MFKQFLVDKGRGKNLPFNAKENIMPKYNFDYRCNYFEQWIILIQSLFPFCQHVTNPPPIKQFCLLDQSSLDTRSNTVLGSHHEVTPMLTLELLSPPLTVQHTTTILCHMLDLECCLLHTTISQCIKDHSPKQYSDHWTLTNTEKGWLVIYHIIQEVFLVNKRSPILKHDIFIYGRPVHQRMIATPCHIMLQFYSQKHYFYYTIHSTISAMQECLSCPKKIEKVRLGDSGPQPKRTKFQYSLALLKLKVTLKLETNQGILGSHGHLQNRRCTVFGGDVYGICQTVYNSLHDLSLNDEVRLNKVQFLDEADGQFPLLTPLEQAVVLGTFVYTQKAQPKDKLSEEELLPYLSCILTSPQSWSLQMAALLFRCRLESNSSRTVERSMMQAQELVDCLEAAEPSVAARASNLFNSYLPPHWRIQADLANLLLSLGSVKSALNIYLQLDLWEDVIRCYNILEQRHLAAEIIRQKLNAGETVKLWCLLGDATDDVSCYERGWELSKQKSGRAQRHWALYYFRRRCYAESIPHFQASLALNSLQVTLWFQFGFACLDQEKWELCATAYRRYCTLDPEYDCIFEICVVQNFEAWNNLAKAYAKMGQKARAWKALQEAVKCNYENWQVWDNLLVVSTDCGEFEEVIHSYHRILDLKKRHLDLEVLKILVNAVASDLPDNRGIPAGRHKKNALALFGRLTGQITNDTLLWKLYAQLTASAPEQTPETLHKTVQYLQKAHRCAVQSQHWARDVAHCKNVADLCVNLANACMECCKNCSSSNEAVQMLSSAKLSLKGVLTKIKNNLGQPHIHCTRVVNSRASTLRYHFREVRSGPRELFLQSSPSTWVLEPTTTARSSTALPEAAILDVAVGALQHHYRTLQRCQSPISTRSFL
ncbi:hypothetical protein PR048_007768 [Dryococelus australis]|uniref:Tetratricopeptide repeat protein 27 n=1 Tax=Dryococelus australis TaxID=614101 RepID=A0ABQ9HV83_9NEOP|nr:hypothetical protein PR048_007768 [Dryococelus australis]